MAAARRWADESVAATTGCHLAQSLIARAIVTTFEGDTERAERDAHDALAVLAGTPAYGGAPTGLECLAKFAVDAGNHRDAARLYGAAEGIRRRTGQVRFAFSYPVYEASVNALRDVMDPNDLASAWAEGLGLSNQEALAFAQRGRGERKRPTTGWAALTPTERDVVRLVSEGLPNKDIAARLFVSPRTVQTHLTHVYTKLGLSSRVQLAREAAAQG